MATDLAAVVFDNSSKRTKAGYAGDDAPRIEFPSVVGRRKNYGICMLGSKAVKDVFVGDEVDDSSTQLNNLITLHPMEDGVVTNWDDMERIWDHAFSQLKVEATEHPLLIADRFITLPLKDNRETMTQVVFETFEVPLFYACHAEVLSMYMYATSIDHLNTAIRIHSNDTSTTIVPLMDGMIMPHAATRLNIGGRDVTNSLQALLSQKGHSLETATVDDIKHQLCYFALDPETESDPATPWIDQPYKLPDGRIISIGEERFKAPEAIFASNTPNSDSRPSLLDAISHVISKCDKGLRSEMLRDIYISGGNTRFPGYKDRMARELKMLDRPEDWRPEWEVVVNTRADEKDAAWIGGSIFASSSIIHDMWIAKGEYDEVGPTIVRRKCF